MSADRKVFILCPAGAVSGGPEALHQLAGALRAKNVAASMVYYPAAPPGPAVPLPYRHYGAAVSTTIDDDPSAVIVIPEVSTSLAWQFPRSQKVIWWLSVDNYFKWQHCNPGPSILAPHADVAHVSQSHYAYDFLVRQDVQPLLMLTDYLTAGDFAPGPAPGRLPIVAFNPRKAPETTQRLMAQDSEVMWLPLEGLDKTALADLLRQVRIYADFGAHPGRDRIPREAALCGAVVVTGRKGAAGFAEDVPLPSRFRLDERNADFDTRARALIDELLNSDRAFLDAWAEQAPYRDWISSGLETFMAEVDGFVSAMHLDASGD